MIEIEPQGIKMQFLDACSDNNVALIKELLPQIDNLNYRFAHNSPIWHAISNDSLKLVDLFIEHGARLNEDYSVIHGVQSIAMLEKLISYGLDIHYEEDLTDSPLYCIAIHTELDVAQKLIELGVKYQHLDFSESPNRKQKMMTFIAKFEAKKEKDYLEWQIHSNDKMNKIKL